MAELRESSDRPPIEELVRLNEIAGGPWSGEASVAVRNIERWSEQHLDSLVAYAMRLERKAKAFELIATGEVQVGRFGDWWSAKSRSRPARISSLSPDLLTAIELANESGKEAPVAQQNAD